MPLWVRALLALALAVGFYLLAAALVVSLVAAPLGEIAMLGRIHVKLMLFCWAGAGIIAVSLVPRPDAFTPPGPELDRAAHPRLFAEIDRIADRAGQAGPAEVYLLPDVNAFVTTRGGFLGLGSRRVMGLGLPLLQILTVSELRAVLAHEFGHYHAGDTRLGPLVYSTRASMGRTVSNLSSSHPVLAIVSLPFRAYATMFLALTLAVSRAQEYAADALAARIAGAAPMRSALRRIDGAARVFGSYLGQEVEPVLAAGFVPPVGPGFAAFLASPGVSSAVDAFLVHELAEGKASHTDSHPCLRERLAALDGLPDSPEPLDADPAIALLTDPPGVERQLLDALIRGPLPPTAIAWDDVGERVARPQVARQAAQAAGLAGRAIRELADPAVWVAAAGKLDPNGKAPADQRAAVGRHLVAAAVLHHLSTEGWSLRSHPGEPVTAVRDGATFAPVLHLDEGWDAAVAAAGIGDLVLGGVHV